MKQNVLTIMQEKLAFDCLILILASVLLFNVQAAFASEPPKIDSGSQTDLKNIDTEINKLKTELNEYRKKALNQEMKAQQFMFDNWEQFSTDLRINEEDEKKVSSIKQTLRELEEKKKELIKIKSSI